jgi:hypothetical protein
MLLLCCALPALAASNAAAQKQVTYEQVVKPAVPVMTLSASAFSIQVGSPLTLSATLAGGSEAPTGQVSFFDGAATLVQGVPLQAGESGTMLATYTFSTRAAGIHTITGSYAGDANYVPVVSAPIIVAVNPNPGFTILATPVNVIRGSSTGNTAIITMTPVGNFAGTVSLAAGIVSTPPNASELPVLNFSSGNPATLTGSSSQTAILTITTTAPPPTAASRGSGRNELLATSGAILAGMAIFGAPRRRHWQSFLGLWFLLAILSTTVTGCSEITFGSHQTSASPTTPGTYVVAITGASGTVTASGFFTLIVR